MARRACGCEGRAAVRRLMLISVLLALGASAPALASEPYPYPLPGPLFVFPAGGVATGPTTATVSLLVPSGSPRTMTVRYGRGPAFDHETAPVPVTGGSPALFRLTGLEPGTSYRYEFVDGAATSGADTFDTSPSGAPAELEPPRIVDAGGGEYRCEQGRWDDASATLGFSAPQLGSVGSTVLPARCRATATNTAGTSSALSADTLSIDPLSTAGITLAYAPPAFYSPPTVTVDGQHLTCKEGAMSTGGGRLHPNAFAWLRDDTPIATGSAYDLVPDDGGHSLICRVTASNAFGASSRDSAGVPVTPVPPPQTTPVPPGFPGPRVASSGLSPAAALARLLLQADRLTVRGQQTWVFTAPGPGRLRIIVRRGRRALAAGRAVARAAGTLRVRTRPTAAARRALRDVRHAVQVEVAFTGAGAKRAIVRRRTMKL